jgi:RNA polymerase sigma-70 factor (ECF subfamily)
MIINRSEKEYDYNLLVETVNATVDSLPQQTRCVFRMSRDENLTNKQIAEKLNISVKTVEKHMTRALSTLRAKMVEYNFLSLAIFLLLEKIITHIK